ncbi:hypothetical protein J7E96_24225 [Streptomyces sp. ISL-96]|uniref:hypothetical protein n=1 Tax=Streptomyces sp. ISL-96 TaxID=2819191 RepID=UPI001BE8D7BC|nr:hypothetical protein [Streptomyces sp. ISL-96]MBT2491577.1 hypothetical protein [Streptomyces sp. ISL-96]
MGKRFALICGGALAPAAAVAAGVWLIWFRPPYALADSPSADVTVKAEKSEYADVAETAEDVDTLVKVYVQRLKAGDAEGLARLAGPDFGQPGADARKFVREYADDAQGRVEATVVEGVVPYFNRVGLAYEKTGRRQELLLVKDDGHWWVALGDGDPAAGNGS